MNSESTLRDHAERLATLEGREKRWDKVATQVEVLNTWHTEVTTTLRNMKWLLWGVVAIVGIDRLLNWISVLAAHGGG